MDLYTTAFEKKSTQSQTGRRFFVVLLLLSGCLLTRAPLHAQDILSTKLSLRVAQRPLKDVFRAIQLQTGLTIEYQHDLLNTERAVSLNVKDELLSKVLERLLAGTGTKYIRQGKSILIIKDDRPEPAKATSDPSSPGSLHGRVVDFESARPLPGASIRVEGNSGGTLTDDKGYYTIKHLAPGIYALTVTYIGYQPNKFPGIKIESGKTGTYDIKMTTKGELQEVVVRSGARRVGAVTYTTESQLINEIRGANGVVSGISSEMISKSADRNAAEVVKRLSGVTVVDDKFIVVRGMNQRYNITYLNGSIAPSTELYNRAFSYDMLPSSIIDRILVYKSPAANLLGDYAGGAVEVFTKNAKPVKHLDIGVQAGYRPGSNFGALINSYQGGKYDWLGFDDGTRKLSPSIPGVIESDGRNTMSQQQLLKAFSPTLQSNTKKSTPDLQLFANYFDNWSLGKWRLYNLTSVTYTKETTHFSIYRQTGNTYGYMLDTTITGGGETNYIGADDQSTEKAKLNILQNFTLRLNKNHRLSFNNFLLNEGSQMVGIFNSRQNTGSKFDSLSGYPRKKRIILSYQQRILYTGNLGGEHSFGHDSAHAVQWGLGYSFSRQDVPDQRISNFVSYYSPVADVPSNAERPDKRWTITPGTGQQEILMGRISRIFARNDERVYTVSADYKFKISPALSLRAGTYHLFRSRLVNRRLFKIHQANLETSFFSPAYMEEQLAGYGSIDYNKANFRLDQLGSVWSPAFFPENGSGLKVFEMTTPADRYDASEQNNSGYVMGDWKPANGKWTVNAGLRVEYNQQKIAGAYTHSSGIIFPLAVNNTNTQWLPSVNISYLPNPTMVIRGSYGRTVNRPEFREMTPYNDYDFVNNELIRGNLIKSASIDNYDLRAELYPKSVAANEMISIGVFYKDITNPIERIRDEATVEERGNMAYISFINSDRAKLWGAELEFRKSLAFIPGNLFRKLSLVGNAAWIRSETEKHHFLNTYEKQYFGEFSGRPLQGQAPYVINGGLFYENAGWGTKTGVTYVVNGPNIYAISIRNKNNPRAGGNAGLDYFRPSLLELPRHQLDLSFTQRLVGTLTMRLNIQNILEQPYSMIEDHNDNQQYDPERPAISAGGEKYYTGDNYYKKFNPGRYFTLTVTYAF